MSRYDRYGLPVRRWDSVASFRRGSKLLAGIDVIALPSGSIVEMFTSGDVTAPRTATIPVVFTGASRNGTPSNRRTSAARTWAGNWISP